MGKKLSVIVPIYNVEPYLRQCLDSIVNQTYRNLEIILIDDGSPDNCGVICDEYAAKDDRIVVIHKENGGLSAARNDGIVRATGEWLTFVDSDDWCELDYYEQMLKKPLEPDTDIVCASSHYVESSFKGVALQHCFFDEFSFASGEGQRILMDRVLMKTVGVLKGNAPFGYPWDKLYRCDFLQKTQLLFNTSLRACEDSLFNYQVMSKAGKVVGRVCAGYHYRVNMSSITKAYDSRRPEKYYQYISELHKCTGDYGANERMNKVLDAHVVLCIAACLRTYYFHPNNMMPYAELKKGIKKMISKPYYHKAIYSPDNKYLTLKLTAMKYALRFGWVEVIRAFYRTKQLVSR